MQLSGIGSESWYTAFDSTTTAAVRKIRHALKVAWTRVSDSTRSAFTIGTSTIGGVDLIVGQSNVITQPDYFEYWDETEHALRLEYDRSVDEPLGGIAYTVGDILLDNNSLRFTPEYNATIGTALLPNRPLKMFMGFVVNGIERIIPILYGTTRDVKEDKVGRTAEVSAYDYLYYINNYPLETTIYEDQRSDQIIEDILTTIGFVPTQYNLDVGLNTIPFAWFEKGQTAGSRIRQICEAEEATFYQDEFGVLQFKNRRSILSAPYNASVWTFNPEDIEYWEEDQTAPVINRSVIKAEIRSVKGTSEVYRLGVAEEIPAGGTHVIWASFEDPVTAITTPAASTDYFANTADDGSGTDVTSDLNLSVTLFTTTAKVEVTNNHGSNVFLTFFRLRGTPATIDSKVEEVFEDTTSQDNYNVQQFEVDNDYIADDSFAYYLARALVRKYKDPRRRVKLTVPAVPHLQLRDRVTVKDPDTGNSNDYRVMRIQGTMLPGNFYQTVTLREISGLEAESPFIIGTSTIGGSDVIWI